MKTVTMRFDTFWAYAKALGIKGPGALSESAYASLLEEWNALPDDDQGEEEDEGEDKEEPEGARTDSDRKNQGEGAVGGKRGKKAKAGVRYPPAPGGANARAGRTKAGLARWQQRWIESGIRG
jgi:hypothetical protein